MDELLGMPYILGFLIRLFQELSSISCLFSAKSDQKRQKVTKTAMAIKIGLKFGVKSYISFQNKKTMAKAKGILQVEGQLGDLVFYKMGGERYVRLKDLYRKQRIAHSPNFERTRENNCEFGQCSSAGKLVRNALAPLLIKTKDSQLAGRMLGVMNRIKDMDTNSPRGLRKVSEGLKTDEGKALISGFDFNSHARLGEVLQSNWQLDRQAGILRIPDFTPDKQLRFPKGATQAVFSLAVLRVDFATGEYAVTFSLPVTVPRRSTPINLFLTPESLPDGSGTLFSVLSISFFQEMSETAYRLHSEKSNVLSVLQVM